jgi:phosphatidylglycerophosphate synthase
MKESVENRRPVKARSNSWAKRIASFLAAKGVSPNSISVMSVILASLCAAILVWYRTPIGLVCCAVTIQGRLLCNLLDGMVAVEHGKGSILGQLYNEFPDRISDVVILVALGYATDLAALGWFSGLLAVLTAYVRVFGGSLALKQDFRGPLAKQRRMDVVTLGCVCQIAELLTVKTMYSLKIALFVVAVGTAVTCITRTVAIVKELKQQSA